MKPPLHLGQPSWSLRSDRVGLHLTRLGGMLGPVGFQLPDGRTVRPLSVAPWARESPPPDCPPLLRALRGDFLCLPFGANAAPVAGIRHPLHGEPANRTWPAPRIDRVDGTVRLRTTLRLRLQPGRITKEVRLVPGETAVYQRHLLQGAAGPVSYGHHVMLAFAEDEEPGHLSVSRLDLGRTYPGLFEDPALGGRSCLAPDAGFRSLGRVPLADGGRADLGRYPARPGFEDLVTLGARPAPRPARPAWTCMVYPSRGYLWFQLKDPRTLPLTLLWHSHGGRPYPPWSGRHRGVLGVEETCGLVQGLAESIAPNPFSRAGIPTHRTLAPGDTLEVRTAMGVCPIPPGFGPVRRLRTGRDGTLTFSDPSGAMATTRADAAWVLGGVPLPMPG